MTPPAAQASSGSIDRREAIRRAAILAGVAFAPSWLACAERLPAASPPKYLSPAQLALTAAIAERIIPKTDTPGAADVGVPAFIDALYGEFMTPDEQAMFKSGLEETDAASMSAHASTFVQLSGDRQDQVLKTLAAAAQDKQESFFKQMRTATVLGYFTSETVGKTVLNYLPVPGRYEACVPIEDVGRRNWTT